MLSIGGQVQRGGGGGRRRKGRVGGKEGEEEKGREGRKERDERERRRQGGRDRREREEHGSDVKVGWIPKVHGRQQMNSAHVPNLPLGDCFLLTATVVFSVGGCEYRHT